MDNSPMLSTPFPETILCDGHSSASGTTAFATCKSLHLNFCRVLPKVSFRYLLVEDKQGTSVVNLFSRIFTTETQSITEFCTEKCFFRQTPSSGLRREILSAPQR